MLTDFKSSFTSTLGRKFTVNWSLKSQNAYYGAL